MGGWSPSLPDARWRDVARLLGNYAIPLICLGLVVWVLALILLRRRSGELVESPPPASGLRVAAPFLAVIASVAVLFGWSLMTRRPTEIEMAYRMEQKIAAYDLVRYVGPEPPERRKIRIWIARSYVAEGVTNRLLNVNSVGVLWIVTWSAVVVFWRRDQEASA
jgi:hypothetical protein